jgi:hypothetical protein
LAKTNGFGDPDPSEQKTLGNPDVSVKHGAHTKQKLDTDISFCSLNIQLRTMSLVPFLQGILDTVISPEQ